MNFEEKQAKKFLLYLGYSNPTYEPDGNIPPDFSVDDSIAIEVRRLNEHYFGKEKTIGLSVDAIPLWAKISKLLKEFGAPLDDESWFVSIQFSRPLGDWKNLKNDIKKALKNFLDSTRTNRVILKTQSIQLDVFKASEPLDCLFNIGASLDEQSGGFLLSILQANIKHCIEEKTAKISKYRSRYKQWWLVLVDHLGNTLSERDRMQFREYVKIKHDWDKVILLSPEDYKKYFII